MKSNFKRIIFTVSMILFTTLGVWAFSFRNMTLDFIDISDTHISNREDTSFKALSSSKDILDDAVAQINEIKGLDFVLFTGDMVDSATENNFYNYYSSLSKLKYPTLNAFGNHDFYGKSKEETLSIVKKYNPNYVFNDTYYAFSPKTDYRIIILDSVDTDATTSNGELSEEQLQFLDDELNQNQNKVVLIALHHPPVEPFVSKEHSLLNADRFNEILIKYKNPIVVVSGHYHAAKIKIIGNIIYVSTPSMVTYPMAFRHIKIVNYKDRVSYKFEFIETNLKEIQEKNRQSVISYGALIGTQKDRTLEYVFHKNHPKSEKYKINKIKKADTEAKNNREEMEKFSTQKAIKNNKQTKIKKEKNTQPKENKIINIFKKRTEKKQEKNLKNAG